MECHCVTQGSFKTWLQIMVPLFCKTKSRRNRERERRGIVIVTSQASFKDREERTKQSQQTQTNKQTSMANSYTWLFLAISATLLLLLSSSPTADAGALGMEMTWIPSMPMEEEFQLDSEISRRILATTKYISYGALQRNTVPCSRRGASYYNCQPGAQANPYSRGCSAITRCRS
ncbi:hypothetical protein GLYMA_03G236000v4 [Glycine max]|uniref:protein RALF-like 1 n=1 Tax=Glycine max TaxID=3847 RepID=UPI001B3574D5|nr:protein RALF-like 1 [Glycine max]KRH68518.2 hypothetical protein GLYMA_03G236000v4 [Glycine max]